MKPNSTWRAWAFQEKSQRRVCHCPEDGCEGNAAICRQGKRRVWGAMASRPRAMPLSSRPRAMPCSKQGALQQHVCHGPDDDRCNANVAIGGPAKANGKPTGGDTTQPGAMPPGQKGTIVTRRLRVLGGHGGAIQQQLVYIQARGRKLDLGPPQVAQEELRLEGDDLSIGLARRSQVRS